MTVKFNRSDLEFILEQIRMAEASQPPVNAHLAFGLRELAGTNNNLVAGQSTFGSADQIFPRTTAPLFQTVTVNIDGTIFDPDPDAVNTITTSYMQTAVSAAVNPFADPSGAGWVIDTAPRTISNLIVDQSGANTAAVQASEDFFAQLGDGYLAQNTLSASNNTNLFIGNITPDAGLSAPFNTWMALFGQFFDHGLDLVTKGGSGAVFVPLKPDDPLIVLGPDGVANTGDEVPLSQAFMVLTRATNLPGADGILGTADDIHANTNTVSPFVDQNQTYTSNSSHQVFLREYVMGSDGHLHTTGRLLDGVGPDGSKHLPTWADVKQNAVQLGILLSDEDVYDVPLLATDAYGDFIAGPNGHVQLVIANAGGAFTLLEVDPASPIALPTNVARTGHAFLNDIAHIAAPTAAGASGAHLVADADTIAGGAPEAGAYDDELLNAHYIAGDGRANENIGLTAVHEIFHSEHNRLLELTKQMIRDELAAGDSAFATQWVLAGTNLADGIQQNEWNGERLFQVAKFGTETQYQHLVFEEFARKIAPTIHLFGNVDITLDAAITSEFANAVYRFGHSMLNETLPRYAMNADGTPVLDANGQPTLNSIGLIDAFLNPLAYAERGADAAGELVLGTANQIGNEIDEFVTGALRNNLLGLPLDLAALNIARGRDTGVAPLNLVRAQIFAATGDQTLKAYDNWAEFGGFLKHAGSLVNFVAAYGTHASINAHEDLLGKRAAAATLVAAGLNEANRNSADAALRDAYDFMHSLGAYANDTANPLAVHAQWSTGSVTGVDNIDLWIGGLAEKQSLFGGLLGSTFNFIFETQLESLQDGDRLYYLPRIEGLHWGSEIEGNTFASIIEANTRAHHLSASIFLTPEYVVEASNYFLRDSTGEFVLDTNGKRIATAPAAWLHNPATGALLVEVLPDGTVHFIGDDNFFGNTMVLGGTSGNDRLQAGHADDDTVWGDGGDDWIDGGNGNDQLFGGTGNDTFVDSGGNDIIHGDEGSDTVFGGIGDDIVLGGDGDDVVDGGAGIDAIQGGLGNDILRGNEDADELIGNEGDDWLEGGAGGDLLNGDQGAPTGQVPLIAGNDVLIGGPEGDRMQGFSGDDIMLGLGGFDRFEGGLGFDWASYELSTQGQQVDMNRRIFVTGTVVGADAVRDVFAETEGVSGSAFDDWLQGTNVAVTNPLFNELTNVSLIRGLNTFFPAGPVAFSDGDIMLGGDGNDRLEGRGGNDILDGDAWLHVEMASGQIIRQIGVDSTPGDVDIAVYNDNFANYTLTAPDAQGFWTITHLAVTPGLGIVLEGTDKLRNIERVQFLDQTISLVTGAGANAVPVGNVLILGDVAPATPIVDPIVGQALTASVAGVSDADGIVPGSFRYQWEVQDLARLAFSPIAGATSATFAPTNFQQGTALRVTISYTDGKGYVEHLTSAATSNVAFPANINTAPFVVPQQGLVGLPDTSAEVGTAINLSLPVAQTFGDAQTPSNQLVYTATLANGAALSTVGLSFTVLKDAAGLVTSATLTGTLNSVGPVSVRVTATDGGPGEPLSVTDTFIVNVLPPINDGQAPLTLTGAAGATGVLTAALGADPDGPASAITYQWFRDNVAIAPASSSASYTVAFADIGHRLSAKALYTDGQGFHEVAVSTPIEIGSVKLNPDLSIGDTLTMIATHNLTDPDQGIIPHSESYRWEFSTNGSTWTSAPAARVSFDRFSPAATNAAGAYARVFVSYIDWLSGENTALSQSFHYVRTGATADTIVGAVGQSDIIFAGGAADNITAGVESDTVNAGAGNDTIFATVGDGNDYYDGGAGTDTFDASASVAAVAIDLSAGTASGSDIGQDTLAGIERATGGASADSLTGNALVNLLIGGEGADTLDGGTAGNDRLEGGGGNDLYLVDHTGVTIVDSAGLDTVRSSVTITLAAGVEILELTGVAAINGTGNGLDNVITGNFGPNSLNGGAGNDRIIAFVGDGDDTVNGGGGIDTYDLSAITANINVDLIAGVSSSTQTGSDIVVGIENVIGGAGADRITASTQQNTLSGGAGGDAFIFQTRQGAGAGTARDIITDFAPGSDRIDLHLIDADTRAAAAGLQAFAFVGLTSPGAEAVGTIGYHYETISGVSYTVIEGNVRTGASITELTQEFQIALLGAHVLTASDLILI